MYENIELFWGPCNFVEIEKLDKMMWVHKQVNQASRFEEICV